MNTTQKAKDVTSSIGRKKSEWMPRIWEGCDFFAWLKLLAKNRCAVHWKYWYIALIVTIVSVCHTALRILQSSWFGDRPEKTPIKEAPVFIIGHWRTGTTFLHELLILDPRHSFPTTYECLEPNHFLLTERFLTKALWFLMPSRRPMDNMAAGWDRPQEDEFALCMLGQPSPYTTIAFPNHPPQGQEAFDLEKLSPRIVTGWKKTFFRFLQQVTFKNPKRLILKSPPHSCRIQVLRELFPDARFVHIVRNPYVVFPSTVNLWKTLYATHGLQVPNYQGLEEHVLQTFENMYRKIEQTRHLVPPRRFFELKYEDLVRNPLVQVKVLYDHLELGDFATLKPHLERYLSALKGYETNKYPQLSPEQRAEITRRWGHVIRQYGYAMPPEQPTTSQNSIVAKQHKQESRLQQVLGG